ncbi:MAG: DUF2706 domain-containing protein [Rickettsiales bacterium]|nr:MAG: DUF2706 domain-containing protein [Rickettsiales bacterium]
MKCCIRIILSIISLFVVLSCTPGAPYEVRSPCVSSGDSGHTYGVNPCVRRPLNMKYAIV